MYSDTESYLKAAGLQNTDLSGILGNAFGVIMSQRQPDQVGEVLVGPGGENPLKSFKLKVLSSREKADLEEAKKFIMEQNVKSVLKKQSLNMQQQQMSHLKRTQALMLLSRIYVGSISYEITEDILRTAFSPFGPIKSVSLSWDPMTHKHKGFCFLEYELPEAAQLALDQMNGMPMGGRNLKVGRPSNIPQAQPIIDEIIGEAKLFNRIYVCSVHPDLTEEDLRTVFEAFGKITYCKLTPDNAWSAKKHRGFGYIEYEKAQSAMDAVTSMNMFDLGGQLLRVGRAITPPSALLSSASRPATASASVSVSHSGSPGNKGASALPTAAAIAAASITAQVIAMEAGNFSPVHANNYSSGSSPQVNEIPPPQVVVPKLGSRSGGDRRSRENETLELTSHSAWEDDDKHESQILLKPAVTRVVLLRNMVDPSECDDGLKAEIKEECENSGRVNDVAFHFEGDDVHIFVLFDDCDGAQRAIDQLDGRFFAKRQVMAQPFSEEDFFQKYYNS